MALQVYNGFIGHHFIDHNVNFSGMDSEELYHENLKSQPIDWYYRTHTVSYVCNSNGHRCKEINDIDLDNYILYTGCSHTEGVGLSLEDSYAHKLAKALNCDYYNLALEGGGIDTMIHNLNIWLNTVKKRPKYIICQWPDLVRYFAYNEGTYEFHGLWEKDPDVLNFILAGDMNNFFNGRLELAKLLLSKLDNVITVSIHNNDTDIQFLNHDLARDGMHYGRLSNTILAQFLLEKIQQTQKIV